jgi:hypothetical protein
MRQAQIRVQRRARPTGAIRPYPRALSEQSAQAMADAEAVADQIEEATS